MSFLLWFQLLSVASPFCECLLAGGSWISSLLVAAAGVCDDDSLPSALRSFVLEASAVQRFFCAVDATVDLLVLLSLS